MKVRTGIVTNQAEACVVCRGPKPAGFFFCEPCREELRALLLDDPEYRETALGRAARLSPPLCADLRRQIAMGRKNPRPAASI